MPSTVEIRFASELGKSPSEDFSCLIIGQLSHLRKIKFDDIACKLQPKIDAEHFENAVKSLNPNPTDSVQLWTRNTILSCLPDKGSRHNAPMFPHTLTQLVKNGLPGFKNESIVIVCKRSDAFALGCAVARAFPLYSKKTCSKRSSILSQRTINVEFVFVGENDTGLDKSELDCLTVAAESVRLSARIVDTPCNEMNTSHFVEEVKAVGAELNIDPVIIQGEELKERGFGGIYGVGKAALYPPALAILSHRPEGATKTIAWVGKGIVYDTGGLSIKDKVHMPGMKRDCGGAAAVLGAFRAAVKAGFSENLHCLLCLAENAVGPNATRPDDVHTFYSGKTVEVNNTDAEGRLVLGDGVAYAARDLNASIIVDMATLTGAQGISTGHYHAAIVTNDEDYEQACVKAGRWSGDLAHPLPFCPEMHFSEFNSAIADMKNSVKDRGNAQSSCAGLFISNRFMFFSYIGFTYKEVWFSLTILVCSSLMVAHLGFNFPGVWLHIDMASPVHRGERATGYGVALLMTLFGKYSRCPMLQHIAPELK